MNDIEASKEESTEVPKLQSVSLSDERIKQIKKEWQKYERRNCELMRTTGYALSELLMAFDK
jgi:hypothetical protein